MIHFIMKVQMMMIVMMPLKLTLPYDDDVMPFLDDSLLDSDNREKERERE